MMAFIRIIFASVATIILLAGCGEDNSNPLLGKWKTSYAEMGHLKIYSDGKFVDHFKSNKAIISSGVDVKGEIDFKPDEVIFINNGVKKALGIERYIVTAKNNGSKIVALLKYKNGKIIAYVYDNGNKMKLIEKPIYLFYNRVISNNPAVKSGASSNGELLKSTAMDNWNGQEEMAGYLPAGSYSIPFIRAQWNAYVFSNGGGDQYQYGKPLTKAEKQNIKNLNLTASQAKDMAIYQVGNILFLLPRGFKPTRAVAGMNGDAYINMAGRFGAGMSYGLSTSGCTVVDSAARWMPWASHKNLCFNISAIPNLQAAPLDHHRVSAFRYIKNGLPINGAAYYQKYHGFLQTVRFWGTEIPHSEKTQILNFFISNYVHKSTEQKEANAPEIKTESHTNNAYNTARREVLRSDCAEIYSQYTTTASNTIGQINKLDSFGQYGAANQFKVLLEREINNYQNMLNNIGCGITLK